MRIALAGNPNSGKTTMYNALTGRSEKVSGMHCEHCKRRVEEAVNDIKGVAGRVDLKKGELTVSYAEDVDDEIIKAKIERTGYTVTRLINQ